MVFEPFKSGDIFEEKYELLDQIGSGAFAVVYRARDLEIGRDLAIKILLNQSPAFDESTIDRFRLEARTLSRLHHPNSLTLYGFGWTKDHQPFLVTEYVPGQTLRRLLDLEHRLLVPRAVALTRQILLALRDAHAKGVVHRDIKPNNVMIFDRVGEKDVVKVLDFGIAKLVDAIYEEDQELQNLTLRGKVLGTPRYMAPELLCDDGVRPSSDLYSVGLLLYEMITGEEAVKGTDPVQIISRQVGPDPPIAPDDPTIPDPLRAVLLKATTKAVHDRLQSAQEFIDILDTIDIRALAQWRPTKLDTRARDLAQADASPYARSSATRQAATRFVRLAEAAQRLVKGLKGNDSAATVVEAPQLPPDPRVGRSTVTHGRPASTIATTGEYSRFDFEPAPAADAPADAGDDAEVARFSIPPPEDWEPESTSEKLFEQSRRLEATRDGWMIADLSTIAHLGTEAVAATTQRRARPAAIRTPPPNTPRKLPAPLDDGFVEIADIAPDDDLLEAFDGELGDVAEGAVARSEVLGEVVQDDDLLEAVPGDVEEDLDGLASFVASFKDSLLAMDVGGRSPYAPAHPVRPATPDATASRGAPVDAAFEASAPAAAPEAAPVGEARLTLPESGDEPRQDDAPTTPDDGSDELDPLDDDLAPEPELSVDTDGPAQEPRDAAPARAPDARAHLTIPPPSHELQRAEPHRRGGVPTWVFGVVAALVLVGAAVAWFSTFHGATPSNPPPHAPDAGRTPAQALPPDTGAAADAADAESEPVALLGRTVRIRTRPSASTIRQDGTLLGTTPMGIELSPEQVMEVEIEHTGYQTLHLTLDASTADTVLLELAPAAAPDAGLAEPDAPDVGGPITPAPTPAPHPAPPVPGRAPGNVIPRKPAPTPAPPMPTPPAAPAPSPVTPTPAPALETPTSPVSPAPAPATAPAVPKKEGEPVNDGSPAPSSPPASTGSAPASPGEGSVSP